MFIFKRSEESRTKEDFYTKGFTSVMRECRPRAKVACGAKIEDRRWYNCTLRSATDEKVAECFACCEESECGAKVEFFKDEWKEITPTDGPGTDGDKGTTTTAIVLAVVLSIVVFAIIIAVVVVAWKKKLLPKCSN